MKVPVDRCLAGPAMDLAATKALGSEPCDGWRVFRHCPPTYMKDDNICDHQKCYPAEMGSPPYSTLISRAEELWDELAEESWVVSVCWGPGRDDKRYASIQMQRSVFLSGDLLFNNPREMNAVGETKALAICRAFLKARGVTEIEVEEESGGQG